MPLNNGEFGMEVKTRKLDSKTSSNARSVNPQNTFGRSGTNQRSRSLAFGPAQAHSSTGLVNMSKINQFTNAMHVQGLGGGFIAKRQ